MDLTFVLPYLRPNSEWSLNGEKYEDLIWHSGDALPTLEECEAAWLNIKKDYLLLPLRNKRNVLLSASDWTQVSDAPVDKAAWAEYRQTLRDLPENTTDPENPVWPTPPIEETIEGGD